MKSYINNYFLILVVTLGFTINFTSCSDENFNKEEETIDEILPDTLPYIFATGIITDREGNPLSNVSLDYIVDGETKNTTTNDSGNYKIELLGTNHDRTAVLCQVDGFLPKVELLVIQEEENLEKNIILARGDELDGSPNEYSIADLTTTLINISGQLTDINGIAKTGHLIHLYSSDFSIHLYDITDQNGNWTIAMEPHDNNDIYSYDRCEGSELLYDDISLLEDRDLGTFALPQQLTNVIDFTGFITDCSTQQGLTSGTIHFSYPDITEVISADIVNGQYSIQMPYCAQIVCTDVEIISISELSGVDNFYCQNFIVSENVIDFEVCNGDNPTATGGYFNVNIGGQFFEHESVDVELEVLPGSYAMSGQNIFENRGFIFVTQSMANTGTFIFASLVDLGIEQTPLFSAEDGEINYQIDSVTTEYLYGSFNGTILDQSNNQTEVIDGEFKAKFK